MGTSAKDQYKAFPQTSWTLLSEVRRKDSIGATALAEFTRRYYRPASAYIAAIVQDSDKAEEIAQEFFITVVLSGRLLARLDRAKGSFRPYLKQALRHYVIDAKRKQERKKRRALEEAFRPDGWTAGWERLGPADQLAPDAAFHAAWVRTLLEDALARVQQLCEAKGQTEHLAVFLGRYLSESVDPPSWRELGMAYGIDEKAARSRAETVARHFRLVLRELLVLIIP
jgi:DNA-directed RNA polymerase specialized sigma24 family protein